MLDLHGNNRILIIVPHEDDEINLMGGLLPLLVELGAEVQVCFLTNGDFAAPAAVRLQEALASLECLGISKRQVHFLGYPDASDAVDHSIYHASEPVLGKNGYYTYGCTVKQEYRMEKSKRHSLTNYAGLCEDLTELIIDIKPEIIFCTDLDGHHDHRLCSLALEECIENILQNNYLITPPIIYKGFAYSTTYEGKNDFFKALNVLPAYKPDKSQLAYNTATELDNPCFSWNARVRFPISERCCKRNLWNNILIDAICQHKSQYLRKRIGRIINSDVVFWKMPVTNGKVSLFTLENIAELHAPLNFRFYNETASFKADADANDIGICKILIDNNFAYGEYYIGKETVLPVSIYKYNFSEAASVFLKDNKVVWEKDCLKIPAAVKQVELEVRDGKNNIIEKVCIKRISWIGKVQKLLSLRIQQGLNYMIYKLYRMGRGLANGK